MTGLDSQGTWRHRGEFALTVENWDALLKNRIPLIRARQFLSPEECDRITTELTRLEAFSEYLNPPVGKFGLSQFECQNDKSAYIDAVPKFALDRDNLLRGLVDPQLKLMRWIRDHVTAEVDVARENEKPYFSGVFRETRNGVLLHMDYAPHDASGWSIESVEAQLSWNVYLKTPQTGGSCVLYDQFWQPEDLTRQMPESYGYDRSVLTTQRHENIHPRIGDLVIFNSRNFHEVLPSNDTRITVSSFIGQMPDGSVTFWS